MSTLIKKNEQEIETIKAAIRSGDVDKLRQLLAAGYRVNPEWEQNEFLLYDDRIGFYFRLASKNDFPLLYAISEGTLAEPSDDYFTEDKPKQDPKTCREIIKLLLEHGARITPIHPRFKKTYLTYAIENSNAEAVELLLSSKTCHPDQADFAGNIPLHFAVESSAWGIVPLLLKFGANPNNKDQHGRTALDMVLHRTKRVREIALQNPYPHLVAEPSIAEETAALFDMLQHGATFAWENEIFCDLVPNLVSLAVRSDTALLSRLVCTFGLMCEPCSDTRAAAPRLTEQQHRALRSSFYEGLKTSFYGDRPIVALLCCLPLLDTLWISAWLFLAADFGKPEFVRLFLRLGADPKEKFEINPPFKGQSGKTHQGFCRPSQIAQFKLDSAKSPEGRLAWVECERLLKEAEDKGVSPMKLAILHDLESVRSFFQRS